MGHGGASGYIAVLALAGYSTLWIRQDALLLNLLVSGIAFLHFFRKGYFSFRLFLPLILCSIPMAFMGGKIQLDGEVYKRVLGCLLLIPAMMFLIDMKPKDAPSRELPILLAMAIGLVLGFASGLTGIGGGVFLSPILVLGRWAGQKTTAAISAPFIFVNSAAGLLGAMNHTPGWDINVVYFGLVAVLGGFAGARLGAGMFSSFVLKKTLAIVLLVAAIKLMFI